MAEKWFPPQEELDALLRETPEFDPEEVKRRTLSKIERNGTPGGKKPMLRGLLIAAAVCVLSVSALAAANTATGGRIAAFLGLPVREQAEQTENKPAAAEKEPEPVQKPAAAPAVSALPEDSSQELDGQLAGALKIPAPQVKKLRPAVQKVDRTSEAQGLRMTVLQTLGDGKNLYVKVRFDFPESVPAADDLQFERMEAHLDDSDRWCSVVGWSVLEKSAHSATYLAEINGMTDLNGGTLTLTCNNYGRQRDADTGENEGNYFFTLEAGKPSTVLVNASGDLSTDADPVPAPDPATADEKSADGGRGVVIYRWRDGTLLLTYDGSRGPQSGTVRLRDGEPPEVLLGEEYTHPHFDIVLAGTWSQTWKVSYQDLTRSWTGRQSLFAPSLYLTHLRLGLLSLSLDFGGTLDRGDPDAAIPMTDVPQKMELTFRCRDGSAFKRVCAGYGSYEMHSEDDGTYTVSMQRPLDPPVDLTQITAVMVGGVTFPLQ
ncbi:MAG: hypothetical protein LKJ80_01470 [Oscillibacter sp.]|jgi:hypothetical protein|nr:hypothetical protein [Oscillibacter sp.]